MIVRADTDAFESAKRWMEGLKVAWRSTVEPDDRHGYDPTAKVVAGLVRYWQDQGSNGLTYEMGPTQTWSSLGALKAALDDPASERP